ncbi:hypothetical protein LGT39_05285 [Demequina sp. TTPB684]|uniref:hypothetical protein n=1 Tax=unclassified Demequina TaxID=2620311 RepID=UPI001CF26178|nr:MULTISPECIES: hypothetical protein [unclassified Demequina]MCB2412260.1 hypothetical protein [Demequina sp. TTPB684]UPU87102.1 hypothetical protein LGT36_007360 [Demequina sp. TMPB413]
MWVILSDGGDAVAPAVRPNLNWGLVVEARGPRGSEAGGVLLASTLAHGGVQKVRNDALFVPLYYSSVS